jgi:hypothetical protein
MAELKTLFNTQTGEGLSGTQGNSSTMSLQFPTELGTKAISAEGNSLEHFIVFYVNTMQNDRYYGENAKVDRPVSTDSPPLIESSSKISSIPTTGIGAQAALLLRVKSWKRTQIMIALPMPLQIAKSYSANWTNTTTAGGLAGDLLVGGLKGKVDLAVQNFLNKSPILAAKSGRVQNPRTEAMFESILPGNNNFEWTLFPKTPEESKAIWNIIQMFKWAMLPDIDKNELFYDVPNTVDIEYWTDGIRNDWLPRAMTSYIRNLSVNYCPAGHWVALNLEKDINNKDWPDGAPPVGVTIALDVGELTALDKRMIDPEGDFSFGKTMNRGTL